MACHCHGKKGESVLIAKPFDQCTACARKHVKNAWSKWNEFTYEDENRDYVSAQLRDAADHVRNRISSCGDPTELPPDYFTEAQVRALIAAKETDIRNLENRIASLEQQMKWVLNGN